MITRPTPSDTMITTEGAPVVAEAVEPDRIAAGISHLATPVDELRPYPRNPRRGNVDAIADSLTSHGQYRPIVARLDGEVLAGNHTLAAARQLGWTHVAAVRLDVDDEQAMRIVLADNRTADLGVYDDEELITLLGELDASLEGLYGTGWAAEDIKALEALRPHSFWRDPDDIEDTPDVAHLSQPGDVWWLGRHRLMCGDATDHDQVAHLMAGERARLLSTDPPYLVNYDRFNHPHSPGTSVTRDKDWDSPEANPTLYRDFLAAAFAVAVTADTPVYQWHADLRRADVVDAWAEAGLHPHQTIIWAKSMPVFGRSDFAWQHEPCLYGWPSGHRPAKDRRPETTAKTLWEIAQKALRSDIHMTSKPVEIFARPMRWHLKPGEVAYEPFNGSGSQIIAAEMEARTCYAMELQPQYVDAACRRFEDFTGTLPISDATGQPVSFKAEIDG